MDNTNGYSTSGASQSLLHQLNNTSDNNKILNMETSNSNINGGNLSTPKKSFLDAIILKEIRKQLRSPGGCDLHSIQIDPSSAIKTENLNVIKDRYLLSPATQTESNVANKSSYSHLSDLSSSNLKCLDIYTEENFLCKIVNEPVEKVKMAYFRLMQSGCKSEMFAHNLIRDVRDIVPLTKNRTYIVIPLDNGYENLHTYVRDKRRLSESEARNIYRQICETVHLCHQNGIILRDLKLKRFYFIDKERTKIQYESLEGSIILDNPADDTLYEKIGCPLYTAPELLCPNSTYRGKPADMWSLGVILYTMLIGQYPFNEKNGHSLLTNIRNCHVILPNMLSNKARCIIRSLLRRVPEERLIAEDIFFHPWLTEQSDQWNWQFAVDEVQDDHCVPEMEVPDVDMG